MRKPADPVPVPRILGIAAAAFLLGQAPSSASTVAVERHEAAWRATIARTPAPGHGCFEAAYPLVVWRQVGCVAAPRRPYIPAAGSGVSRDTVGGSNDYAAATKKRTSAATGFFAAVKGLKSEKGSNGQSNSYSLQLNSNVMPDTPACSGAADPSVCRGWQQFAFSNGFGVAFMQYWLIDYGAACPAGWDAFETHCFTNSNAIGVSRQPIKQLKALKLSGSAVKNGADTLVLTTKRQAYSVTGDDKVVRLAKGWRASEFNVFGDGGRLQAIFNPGTALTVEVDVTDGTRKAPDCRKDGGTTGETNNLTLGSCIAVAGKTPAIQFKESN